MTFNFLQHVEYFSKEAEEGLLAKFLKSNGMECPADPVQRKEAGGLVHQLR